MILLPMISCNSVDGVPARCLEGHGFDSCQGLRALLVGMLVVNTCLYARAQLCQI